MQPTSVLATITGRDRPGVTAAFFSALAAHDVDVRDVEQVVIRDRLILAVLFDLRGDSAALRNSVTQAAQALGMECEVTVADGPPRRAARGSRSHVIVLGRPLRPGALSHITQRVADIGDNIESLAQLATEPATAVEMIVRTTDPVQLRAVLVQAADETGVDIAVEQAGLRRRAKRLVVLDVDSTLIRDEAIDVLAERAGVSDQVVGITERTMAGELDFVESLRARVALLAGLPEAEVWSVRDALRLTPGARTFVRTLQRLGFQVGVVSGGFTVFTDRFVAELGLDFAAANELEIVDGVVTGKVAGEIIDRPGKAEALERFATQFRVPLSQTVAVGDGANDIDMLEAAGLGIAFNAKSALRAAADTSVNLPFLDTVLFVLGIPRDEIDEADDSDLTR
ncbi:MAG: phosphoserine phosphatase [Pseudonocardiales bacterium]|jgi:phosphoserine phosphatase|nr:phosphoserine phosphatase [Pseudonocardiales bacterium]MDT4943701.1 phosphoserine phosphatase [Pseudonocardiales bacterium]